MTSPPTDAPNGPPKGQNVRKRARRGTAWTLADMAGKHGTRLISNLILTRLLFPEAFGMMAIVQVFLTGLGMFSDTGIRSAIIQNDRGDDPDFLDTAWTVQVLRGGLIWLTACALALPAAWLYDQPQLAQILPVAGLSVLIAGFNPTAVHSASRHLMIGRLTMIDIGCQILSLTVMALLAFWMRSVWALVIGGVIGSAIKLAAYRLWMPGAQNRFRLERTALRQIFHFGKYIFLSTAATFVISQGDRAVLGFFLPLSELGIYTVGFFLANVPMLLVQALRAKVVFPLYRLKPLDGGEANRVALFKARRLLAACGVALAALLAFAGPALVDLLYDPRYALAGPIVTLMSLALVPRLVLNTVGPVLLSVGDSRRFFFMNVTMSALLLVFLIFGVQLAGLFGAIMAPFWAMLLSHPLRVVFARRYNAWDPLQDIAITLAGVALCGAACLLHWERIAPLLPTPG